MHNLIPVLASLGASALVFLGACSSGSSAEPDPATKATGLTLETLTATAVEGTFEDGAAPLRFKSVERAPRQADVTVVAGQTELTMRLDYDRGEGEFDAKSGQLNQAQVGAMLRLMTALAGAVPSEDTTATKALGSTLNFYSVARPDEALPTFKFVAENGWAYIQCRCHFQDAEGYHNWMGVGESCGTSASPHCPGRCGVGCGPDNLGPLGRWGSGKYTADCAKHDYGVGSWAAASDDYIFASANCPGGI
ncbi:hypothetical protein [Pendulispora albinea]|uniref:Uncharacterized protein n=1 Tax=Pendulispora albinea TaxID=2741071 RepID=A0ABZ2LMY4_9BACT